ncbi:hypothetical protein D0Y65_035545 [Glycine soja]|uniref:ATP-dependent DNA helicase n=1 Tax=Glycine soja TaxID=3848 RepID=A0A445HAC9_GLYSO|nr:hypothetical protein D0Y65_035545 [Glycine soja]
MLDEYNVHAKTFRMARDRLQDVQVNNIKLKLIANHEKDGRTYNVPTVPEVAALIVGDFDANSKRDIIIETQHGQLQRIHELHSSYLALQYPLLFPYGEDGYRPDILHSSRSDGKKWKRNRLTMREWFSYRLQCISNESITLLNSRRLFQKFVVDGYTMVDKFCSLQHSLDNGSRRGLNKGKRVILPSTFVGSPRYMDQLYFDGMVICSHVGFPNLFITLTCNQNWPEIHRLLSPLNLKAVDRSDIISRVFKLKYEKMLIDLTKNHMLGKVIAYADGFPVYRRRNNGNAIEKNGVIVDNRYIVPYNPRLLRKYQAHINIEWCNQNTSIKYLFKYINKGYDRVTAVLIDEDNDQTENGGTHNDEIKEYLDCRYICPCESTWRIFGFPIHGRKLVVERLHFHLPGQHSVLYEDHDDIDDLDDRTLQNLVLLQIEELLQANQRLLRDYPSMPYPEDANCPAYLDNSLILAELNYNNEELRSEFEHLFSHMTDEQASIYNQIVEAVNKDKGGMFFLYGYGASSGIASLLFPRGRTAHSKFKILVPVFEDSTCNIHQGTQLAELLNQTSLIIWDEAPMAHKFCFEALDHSRRDIIKHNSKDNKIFGGKVMVFGGDFRQILPTIPRGSRSDIVNATIDSSYLWVHCQILRLTKNMCLQNNMEATDQEEIAAFAQWIIDIGDGIIGDENDGYATIEIPQELLITEYNDPIHSIISSTFPDLSCHHNDPEYFQTRAILASTNETVQRVNDYMLTMIPAIKIPLHLPPPPQSFILIILPIHVQSLNGTFNAPQFSNHLTCRHLHPAPPKSNDPSTTHYFTLSDHGSFLCHLHFNSNQIILSKQLPPCLALHPLPQAKQPLILQFKAAFHCDKDAIEIPGFYQCQWLPNYPEIVEFKYDGETYQIQVRQHKGQLYFADGLTRLRTKLQIYESVMINFLACNHPSKFDLHCTPPLDQQKCKRRRATRKHIWTYEISQSMLGAPYPLQLPASVTQCLIHCGDHMTILRRFRPPLQWNVVVLDKGISDKRAEKIWEVVIKRAIDWDDSDID